VQVQKIVTSAVETAWQTHLKRVDGWKSQVEGAYKSFDVAKKPESYAKDAQVAVEAAIAEAKDAVETTVKTQREVAQVLTGRLLANFNELKSLAA
jgi:vacuolar-type H+-ATPase subunit I/STV1